MKKIVGITGGRDLNDYGLVVEALHLCGFEVGMLVSGACRIKKTDPNRDNQEASGADGLAEKWAKAHGIPIRRFYADWDRFGRRAGPIRNEEMLEIIEALVSLPGGDGTKHMTKITRAKGLPVFVLGGQQ